MTRSLSCPLASLQELPWTELEKLKLKVGRLGALSRRILILQEDCDTSEYYHQIGKVLRNIPKCICGGG
jgi:hypothetical protein